MHLKKKGSEGGGTGVQPFRKKKKNAYDSPREGLSNFAKSTRSENHSKKSTNHQNKPDHHSWGENVEASEEAGESFWPKKEGRGETGLPGKKKVVAGGKKKNRLEGKRERIIERTWPKITPTGGLEKREKAT